MPITTKNAKVKKYFQNIISIFEEVCYNISAKQS